MEAATATKAKGSGIPASRSSRPEIENDSPAW
jgi:hypothetical protein